MSRQGCVNRHRTFAADQVPSCTVEGDPRSAADGYESILPEHPCHYIDTHLNMSQSRRLQLARAKAVPHQRGLQRWQDRKQQWRLQQQAFDLCSKQRRSEYRTVEIAIVDVSRVFEESEDDLASTKGAMPK